MKYFIKLLPVDVRPGWGDRYFDIDGRIQIRDRRDGKEHRSKNCCVAKLFLCSVHIEVGDIFIYEKHEYRCSQINENFYMHYGSIQVPKKGSYKVIGEINPEICNILTPDHEFDEDYLISLGKKVKLVI